MAKHDILGVPIDAVNYETAVSAIIDAAAANRPYAVTALAVHGVMTGVRDAEQRFRISNLDLVCPDGQPVRWALNILYGCALVDRVAGPELMQRLCAAAAKNGFPVFLFGSTSDVLNDLQKNLLRQSSELQVAGVQPSRFRSLTEQEREQDIKTIIESGARIVFVGIGCPRQEVWAYEMRNRLPMPIVSVGAAFAFHAGHFTRGPEFMQRHGLEWLFRLISEPRRLWRRYVILNPLYAMYFMRQWLTGRSVTGQSKRPQTEMRYG